MINITFLGVEGYPNQGRETIGILISKEGNKMLLDCGASIISQIERERLKISDITDVFVSHIHTDHSSGVPLLFFANIMERFLGNISGKGRLRVIGLSSVLDPLLNYCKAAYPVLWKENPFLEVAEGRCDANKPTSFDFGWCKLTTFQTNHTLPSIGCSITVGDTKISFTSDTRILPDFEQAVAESDLLICSVLGTNSESDVSSKFGFMTPAEAGKLASASGSKQLALIHIADRVKRSTCQLEATSAFEHGSVIIPNNGEHVAVRA